MTIKEYAMKGEIAPGLKIIDSHSHVGDGEQGALYIKTLPVAESIRLSKKIGINCMVASHLGCIFGSVVSGNERMMEMTKEYPGYIYASILYDPHYHEECLAQIKKYKDDPAFVGIKIHPRDTGCCIATNDYDKLYEYCIENDILVACHTWETEPANNPKDYFPVMARFPELKLQLCHMGGTYRGCLDSIELANKYKNVYLDFNGSLYTQIWFEELLKEAPLEKWVFGSDQTFNDPRIMVGRVLMAEIEDDAKQQILCDNFERIIGRKLI